MNQRAFPFSFLGEFTDGQRLEFLPTVVRPFGLNELAALTVQPDTLVSLQCLADNPKVNGDTVAGTAKLDGRISFGEKMAIYALVPNGGWLPVPFVSPQHFLLDSNVVVNFRKLRHSSRFAHRQMHEFWTRFFEDGTAVFNPLPYAFEGKARRMPGFSEFVEAFEQGVKEVAELFPRCRVVRYSPPHYRLAYAQLQAIHANTPREIEFLCEISPLLAVPTSDAKLRTVADRILAAAARCNVDRQSLVIVAALSCLFEDPRAGAWSIGRNVLKPKQRYESADAYNAISDLRHIELAAHGHASMANERFALCTSDRGVAALWCALGIRDFGETPTGMEYTFDYSPQLFPRLTEADIGQMASLLAS